ncbi:tetraacyldisaccharide 4'-kinase [Entomomonas asaccharolytica]|uniref:Tetraacyldisaccharide 4'-kinase n=1 Tax=Entomomonas asaccharolytica TaxID=2785331 RepID=A0A974RWE2_9GAMM|nr:tetraacyldisaccharide 4'-kinase [Entomomonas asaccharolytica]QQP85131.1 tetraacyldisaccharide 4'-kinase [Entomomonas asaccharolytica]
MSFSDSLVASWYGQRKPFYWLAPFSKLYAKQALKRREDYLSGKKVAYRAPVPIIVVGNITVGGTGKTPMILWLIDYCRSKGLAVGVVSRGYGAKPAKFPWRVTENQSASETGDEPLLIVKRTQVPLVIDPSRTEAVKHLLATEKIDIILCDDGLQHYQLARDLELVMIDAARGLGNGYCLPMGPLREPASRLQAVDAIIYNGAEQDNDDGYAMQLQPLQLINVLTGERQSLDYFKPQQTLHAVAGIGNPQRFFDTLQQLGWKVVAHPFADHAVFDKTSLDFTDQYPVIMTEKDAVKCKGFAQPHWWYLEVATAPSTTFVKWFDQKISELVG